MPPRNRVTVKVDGLRELESALKQLPHDVRKKVTRRAMKEAMEPMFQAAVQNVPVGDTGNLANSVKLRTSTRRGRIWRAEVNANAPHANLVEFGHRIVTPGGRDTGEYASPNPFIRNAYDETNEQVLERLKNAMQKAIERALARLKKPAKS